MVVIFSELLACASPVARYPESEPSAAGPDIAGVVPGFCAVPPRITAGERAASAGGRARPGYWPVVFTGARGRPRVRG